MTCSTCRNTQCYVCNQSCEYRHFNDISRGGSKGNCPLFDASVEGRHQEEVGRAEQEARKKVQEEYPDIAAELFEIKVSEKVKQDEKKRRKGPVARRAGLHGVVLEVPPNFGMPPEFMLPHG